MMTLIRMSVFTFLYAALISGTVNPVLKDPVIWEFSCTRSGMEATLEMKAMIASPWHLYSTVTPEGGPVPTEFNFIADPGSYSLMGKVSEPAPVAKYDPGFDLQIKYFSKQVTFRQKIKLNRRSSVTIAGTVTYMVCDDEKCLPPNDVEFKIVVPAAQ